MTTLVPKPLVDKNGVRTTRMVREDNRSSAKTSFPSPKAAPVTRLTSKAAASEIVALTSKGIWNNFSGERVDYSEAVMDKLGLEGVNLVHERVIALSEDDAYFVGTLLLHVLRDRDFGSDRVEATCTMIDAVPVVRMFGPQDDSRFLLKNLALLNSVAKENGIWLDDAVVESDRRAVRYLAFHLCMGVYPYARDLKNEAQWFDENCEALVPYINLIKEHGADFDWMKELVSESSVTPLTNGLL
jgi:hypothetical protein